MSMTTERDASGITPGMFQLELRSGYKDEDAPRDCEPYVMASVKILDTTRPFGRRYNRETNDYTPVFTTIAEAHYDDRKSEDTYAHIVKAFEAFTLVPEMIAALRAARRNIKPTNVPRQNVCDQIDRILAQLDNPDAPRIAD